MLLMGSSKALADREAFMRFQVFQWIINARSLKLAMGLKTAKGKKYRLDKIQPRHFLATAEECGFSKQKMTEILEKFATEFPKAVERVKHNLPVDFPEHVSEAIFSHSLQMVQKLELVNKDAE